VELIIRINRFLRRSRMRATNFGQDIAGDPCLVLDLQRGRQPGPALTRRIEAYLDAEEAKLGKKKCRRR
jgi:hypothetical protein